MRGAEGPKHRRASARPRKRGTRCTGFSGHGSDGVKNPRPCSSIQKDHVQVASTRSTAWYESLVAPIVAFSFDLRTACASQWQRHLTDLGFPEEREAFGEPHLEFRAILHRDCW